MTHRSHSGLSALLLCYWWQIGHTARSLLRTKKGWGAVVGATIGAYGNYEMVHGGLQVGHVTAHTMDVFISNGVVALVGFAFMSALAFGVSSLYTANDVDTLCRASVSGASVVASRMMAQLTLGVVGGAYLAGPAFIAVGQLYFGAPAIALMAVALIGVVMSVMALATIVVVTLARLIPVGIIQMASAVVLTGVIFGETVIRLNSVGRRGHGAVATGNALPSITQKAGELISGPLTNGHFGIVVAGVWVAVGLVLFVAAALLGSRWWRAGVADPKRWTRGDQRHARAGVSQRHSPIRAIVTKDMKVLLRDFGQFGQYLMPIVLFVIFASSPAVPVRAGLHIPRWYFPALVAQFGSLFAATGIALRSVSLEGGRFWGMRVAPISMRSVVAAKIVLGSMFTVADGVLTLAVAGQSQGYLGSSLGEAYLFVIAWSIACAAAAVMAGSLRPRFGWTDPRRAGSFPVTLAFLGVGAVALSIIYIVLATTLNLGVPLAATITLGIVGAACTVAISVWIASGRLGRIEV